MLRLWIDRPSARFMIGLPTIETACLSSLSTERSGVEYAKARVLPSAWSVTTASLLRLRCSRSYTSFILYARGRPAWFSPVTQSIPLETPNYMTVLKDYQTQPTRVHPKTHQIFPIAGRFPLVPDRRFPEPLDRFLDELRPSAAVANAFVVCGESEHWLSASSDVFYQPRPLARRSAPSRSRG